MLKQETIPLLREYIDYLISRSDAAHPMWNGELVRSGGRNKWNYIDGCMITSILALHEMTGEEKYLRFADTFMSAYVKEDGRIETYDAAEYNLDNVQPARNLFPLYDRTGRERYRRAMETVRAQLETMPRTKEGSFWHKKIYPNQVWLDGLYMAQPFYMQYETRYHEKHGCLDSFTQFATARKRMRDAKTGLYYHGYDESREMYWADKGTGCSQNFWLRSLGWFTAALTDTIEVMDEQLYYEYRTLQDMLRDFVDALLPWQHPQGMFYQVIDKPDAPGNYLETSGTALIAYGILKAVRLGYLPGKYRPFAEKAFYGTAERYLSRDGNGLPRLGGICLVAGLGGAQRRDGSLSYYFSEPVVENEAKGVAPFLLAFTELLRG